MNSSRGCTLGIFACAIISAWCGNISLTVALGCGVIMAAIWDLCNSLRDVNVNFVIAWPKPDTHSHHYKEE